MIRPDKQRPGLRRALLRRTGMMLPGCGKKTVLGVTGGVGCGKSTVLTQLKEEFGAEIIEADRVSEELMQPGQRVYEAVAAAFGRDILLENGEIDRKALARIVYADPEKLSLLNRLVHPATRAEVGRRIRVSRKGLIVYEAALPKEACFREYCSAVWYIYASVRTRVKRLSDSRGYSEEKSLAIMNRQLSEEEFRSLSDTVIDNDGSKEETRKAVRAAAAALLKKDGKQ